ncbi:hypothetical protein ACOWPH_23160 [Anabaena sp. PCC 7938]|uniref:hypothetical protein n=1 Tax=Anabaena sp. PCC 7938 TaxID=1296340 RepID=UPI003BEF46D9
MTSNYLPPWQKYLNPKLVNRLNKLLTKPGIINNGMARKIIERSPDLIDRLPLLAQQMQRWSTTIELNSESIPIVYVQNQDQKSQTLETQTTNYGSSYSNIVPVNKQLPVVKAKVITVKETSLENQRTQPTELVLKTDNSLPNLAKNTASQQESPAIDLSPNKTFISKSLISSNPIRPTSNISEIPIQRKLDTESSSALTLPVVKVDADKLPQNTFLNLNSEIPVVSQIFQPTISETTPQQPLVNVESLSSSEIPIQRKLDTESSSALTLPVVRVDADKLPQNTSLNLNSEIPVVSQISQPTISETTPQQPLVNVESLSSSEIPIQRKSDTESSSALTLPMVKVDADKLPQNTSLNVSSEIPVVSQIFQQPLVNVESLSSSEIPIQRKSDTESSSALTLPVVKVDADKLPQNTSLNLNSEIPVVSQISQPTISETTPQQPLVNVESLSSSEIPIQRKSDTESSSALTLPVVSRC